MASSRLDDRQRTLPPTPRRLRQARDDGEWAPSPAVLTTLSLGAAFFVVELGGGGVWGRLTTFTRSAMLEAPLAKTLGEGARQASSLFFGSVAPPLAAVLFVVLVGGFLQTRGAVRFSLRAPLSGHPWLAGSSPRSARGGSLLESLLSLGVLVAVAAGSLIQQWPDLCRLGAPRSSLDSPSPVGTLTAMAVFGERLMARLLVASAGLALIEWLGMQRRLRQRLHMTPQEARRELRELEGDPAQKRERLRRVRERGTVRAEAQGDDKLVPSGVERAIFARATTATPARAVVLAVRAAGGPAVVVTEQLEGPLAAERIEEALRRGRWWYEAPALARALSFMAIGAVVPDGLRAELAKFFRRAPPFPAPPTAAD